MEQNIQIQEFLSKIEENSRKQLMFAKIQCFFSIAGAVCCVVLLLLGFEFLPQLRILAEHTEVVLVNLETITQALAQIDLEDMVTNIDALVTASQSGVESAMDKLNEIDLETLNKAIQDLADVVEPLARWIKRLP